MTFPTADMALTHILVVTDPARSRASYADILGGEFYRECAEQGLASRRTQRQRAQYPMAHSCASAQDAMSTAVASCTRLHFTDKHRLNVVAQCA